MIQFPLQVCEHTHTHTLHLLLKYDVHAPHFLSHGGLSLSVDVKENPLNTVKVPEEFLLIQHSVSSRCFYQ